MKRLLACLQGHKPDRRPVWMMRQAGRYLPEYRRTRAKAGSFLALCKTSELACEVSLQPLARFPELDGVIIFSDILTIPDAMGLGLELIEGEGPRFRRPITAAGDIDNLAVPDVVSDLAYTAKTVSLVARAMDEDKTLIGFCGSPWTIACYMCSNDKPERVQSTLQFLASNKKAFGKLLSILTVACADYLSLQVESGAEAVQIFDSWGAALGDQYAEHSLSYIEQIVDRLEDNLRERGLASVPVILYSQVGTEHHDAIANSRINALSVPANISLGQFRHRYGQNMIVQGNLDAKVLCDSDSQTVARATRAVIEDFAEDSGHIFNLGHGITPEARIENVEAMLAEIAGSARGSL